MKLVARVVLAVLLLGGLLVPAPGRAGASPQAPTSAPPPDPLEEFLPREKVPADSAVAFPVDI